MKSGSAFDIGGVLENTWRIARGTASKTAPILILYAVLPQVLIGVLALFVQDDAGASLSRVLGIVATFIAVIAHVAIIHMSLSFLDGESPSAKEAVTRGMKIMVSCWGIELLTGLGIALGAILFLVPGLFLAAAWSVALPVRTVENVSGTDAISRSFELTKTYRLPVFGVGLVVCAIFAVAILVLFGGAVLIGNINSRGQSFAIEVVATPLLSAMFIGVFAAMEASVYHELIRIKEGGGSAVAEVFA